MKSLMYFHELSPTFNKKQVWGGAHFASLNLPRFLWRKVVQEKVVASNCTSYFFFNVLLIYLSRSQLHFDFEYYH